MLWRKSRKRRSSLTSEEQNDVSNNITARAPSSDAAWRVENIMKNGAPSESEWWLAKSTQDTITTNENSMFDSSSSSYSAVDDDNNNNIMISHNDKQQQQNYEFHNCGYVVWEEARKKWRQKTNLNHTKPPPVRRQDIIQGLLKSNRTYELPGRVSLSDMIDVCVVAWGCEND